MRTVRKARKPARKPAKPPIEDFVYDCEQQGMDPVEVSSLDDLPPDFEGVAVIRTGKGPRDYEAHRFGPWEDA